MNTHKILVVVDNTVKMTKGKLARQVAGAVTWSLIEAFTTLRWVSLYRWVKNGTKTVVLKTDDFVGVMEDLNIEGLRFHTVVDAGKTQFKGIPTRTCLSTNIIKEGRKSALDKLKLL